MREIKQVVQALHDAGIEAILQVGVSSSFAHSVLMGAQQDLQRVETEPPCLDCR